jgi:hypothetical protein
MFLISTPQPLPIESVSVEVGTFENVPLPLPGVLMCGKLENH